MSAVPVPVSCFIDYACPFSYIASSQLQRVGDRYPLHIRWRFLEVRPDTPTAGRSLEDGERRTLAAAGQAAREAGIAFTLPTFVANSRLAMLLSQATLDRRPERFPALHLALFRAYFIDGWNIGDPEMLSDLARQHAVDDLLSPAWDSPVFLSQLLGHVEAAQALKLPSVPALLVGSRLFIGTESVRTLEQALVQAHIPSAGQ